LTRCSPSSGVEARDFLDLMAVEPRHGFERLCKLAYEKDRGFDAAIFAEMLGRFSRLQREEFEMDDAGYEELGHVVESWRNYALELARDPNR
jgi:hypothetical protein